MRAQCQSSASTLTRLHTSGGGAAVVARSPTERRYFATAVGKDDSMAAQTSAGALFASTRLTAPDGS